LATGPFLFLGCLSPLRPTSGRAISVAGVERAWATPLASLDDVAGCLGPSVVNFIKAPLDFCFFVNYCYIEERFSF
jgi:hypothetical protein